MKVFKRFLKSFNLSIFRISADKPLYNNGAQYEKHLSEDVSREIIGTSIGASLKYFVAMEESVVG